VKEVETVLANNAFERTGKDCACENGLWLAAQRGR
jgi:hypothetical protein